MTNLKINIKTNLSAKSKKISKASVLIALSFLIANCDGEVKNLNADFFKNKSSLADMQKAGFVFNEQAADIAIKNDEVLAYRTSQAGDKDKLLEEVISITQKPKDITNHIKIELDKKRQTMLGIGGSFTDSAVSNINRLSEKNQAILYDAYFGKFGSRYSVTRITIGSADFSTKFYDYDHDPSIKDDKTGKASRNNDKPDPGALLKNVDLKWFSIEGQDTKFIIPALKRANSYVATYDDAANSYPHNRKELTVFSAPWAAPAWMKGNGKRPGETALAGVFVRYPTYEQHRVQEKYYPAYANYFVKYLKAMKQNGIEIYSISLNNELLNHAAWENTLWYSPHAAQFIGRHLGPQLVKANFKPKSGKGGVKLLVWDWDRPAFGHADGFDKWNHDFLITHKMYNAKKYVDGIAFHWYGGIGNSGKSWGREFNLLDKFSKPPYNMEMYATEASQEGGAFLGEWFPARRYIYDMINTFENSTRTWIDWNLLLDKNGGPTHEVTNNLHAPIHIDFKDEKNLEDDEFIINPAYYVLKRMSLEVRAGSINLATSSDLNNKDIFKTAFLQKDGSISLLVGNIPNDGNDNSAGKEYKLTVVFGNKSFVIQVPANSFSVYKFKP